MINRIKVINKKTINNIRKNRTNNLYLYIDTIKYINNPNVTLFEQLLQGIAACYIICYYDSFQIMGVNDNVDYNELNTFLESYKPKRISGDLSILLHLDIPNYTLSKGWLMGRWKNTNFLKNNCCYPMRYINEKDELQNLIKFVYSDFEIGKNIYSLNQLSNQYKDRISNGCKNLIMLDENRIIGHIATYGETEEIAILGGLLIDDKYRGKGLGRALLSKLSFDLLNQNKEPFFYCWKEQLKNYYINSGWEIIIPFAKLEKNND